MRFIGGDTALGAQLERIRDEMLYASKLIDLEALYQLREKQFQEKTETGKQNAKFSPGGLVDLEYGIQVLQLIHGRDYPGLRTPKLHKALQALTDAGILLETEADRLVAAYDFLRRLINGLRMLRGSASDLFLPSVEAEECNHLARRMDYRGGGGLSPAQELKIDFETHTAGIRIFVETHFGRQSLPGPGTGSVVDLIMSETLSPALREEILKTLGFKNPMRAYKNLKNLAGRGEQRKAFTKLAVIAFDAIQQKPEPDMALNNWERFIRVLSSPAFHYKNLLSQPMRMEILLSLFSVSQFLADTLVRNPEFLDWVTIPHVLHKMRTRQDLGKELRQISATDTNHEQWLNRLRRLKRRELLRIGTRDIVLGVSTVDVMRELSVLADALVQGALEGVWQRLRRDQGGLPDRLKASFCVMAMGKLGGDELNYSSDIDLLGLYETVEGLEEMGGEGAQKILFSKAMEGLSAALSIHTREGYAYRVDLRLRPFGRAGELVSSFTGLRDYYAGTAALWEIQAALKMRPVAGNIQLGHRFVEEIRHLLSMPRDRNRIAESVKKMRKAGMASTNVDLEDSIDVKNGFGGLRDVEFLVQALQLFHAPADPHLIEGNTLRAVDLLRGAGILPEAVADSLREDYLYLRRVEHYLQILDDRQIHVLPEKKAEIETLAKRMFGIDSKADRFAEELKDVLNRVNRTWTEYIMEP
jgi:glutamate-ammonia-ligase adenylyltransferase